MTQPSQDRALTARALLSGAIVGAVLAVGNLYLGMKTGFWDAGYITAAVLGFALAARLPEHTTMVAMATSTSSVPSTMGLLGAIPALALLGAAPGPLALAAWGLALGAGGVLVAVALRPVLVDREQLPFPTARATAEVLLATHGESRRRARALVAGAVAAALFVWFRDATPKLIPGAVMIAGGAGLTLSLGFAGVGVLIGPRIGLDLLLGALLVLVLGRPDSWLLWPGIGLVVGGGLTALALEWRSFRGLGASVRALGEGRRLAAVLLLAAAVVVTAVVGLGVPAHAALAGALVAVPLIAVFLRAYGQTDVAHFAALGNAAQAAVAPVTTSAAANVGAGAIAAGAASQSAAALTLFKVAALAGLPPGPLVAAQLAGVAAGTAVTVPAYLLLDRAYGVGSEALPVPFAQAFRGVAVLAETGLAALPAGALPAMLAATAAGIVFTLAGKTRVGRFAPAPTAVGIAILVPPVMILTIVLGAFAGGLLGRRLPGLPSAAAGAFAGEAVLAVVIALLLVLGVI